MIHDGVYFMTKTPSENDRFEFRTLWSSELLSEIRRLDASSLLLIGPEKYFASSVQTPLLQPEPTPVVQGLSQLRRRTY